MDSRDNTTAPASNTATSKVVNLEEYLSDKGLNMPVAIVGNNQRPILGRFTDEETMALGQLLDRLEGLERAVRIRLNPKALAWMREDVAAMLAMDDEPGGRIAAHGFSILLEMYDAIQAVPK